MLKYIKKIFIITKGSIKDDGSSIKVDGSSKSILSQEDGTKLFREIWNYEIFFKWNI